MAITLANDLIFKEIDTIDVFEIGTGNFMFTMDELTGYSIAHTEESQEVTGKNGRVLSRTKRNKGVTISGTNGIISAGMLALQTGGTYTTGLATIMWADYLTVNNNTATTAYVAIGTLGAEIVSLVVKASDGTVVSELKQATVASTGRFTYDPNTRVLGFSEVPDGTEIVVHYKRQVAATVLENESDKYSGKAMMYINGLAEDKCANVYHVQFFFPKVDFSGEFTLDFSDSQTVHNFEATAMAGACGAGSRYYTYTVFGTNEEEQPIETNYIYFGASSSLDNVTSLEYVYSNEKTRTITVNAGAGKFIIYAIPARLGHVTFHVNGFEGGFESPVEMVLTNIYGYQETYNVYRSTNPNLGVTTVEIEEG